MTVILHEDACTFMTISLSSWNEKSFRQKL